MTDTASAPRLDFQPAQLQQQPLRLYLEGPKSSGKTLTALTAARALGGPIAVIDTQRGTAAVYADEFSFDMLTVHTFTPEGLIDALAHCTDKRYPVVIVDSLTPWWSGFQGILEQVDAASCRAPGNQSGWRDVRPLERGMFNALLAYPGHLIATVRTKTDVVVDVDDAGRAGRRVISLKPDQREGLEYEWPLVGTLDTANTLTLSAPDRDLNGSQFTKPGQDFADAIADWTSRGAPPAESVWDLIDQAIDPAATFDELGHLRDRVRARGAEWASILDPHTHKAITLAEFITKRGHHLSAHP